MTTKRAVSGYEAAAHDFVDLFDCCRPAPADLITRLYASDLRAQFCRGYLAFFVRHNLLSREDVDMVLGEIAPASWAIRHLPKSYLEA